MEIILKTDSAFKVAKVMALAKEIDNDNKEALKKRILHFQKESQSSFGDPAEWERNQRRDRTLPF
jgi:hypothetical protein